jgi:hypothetical protein
MPDPILRRPGLLGPPQKPSGDQSLGGLLNTAALATAPIPGVGDVVGGAADLNNLVQDPSLANCLRRCRMLA